jgi:hypothetical protein
MHINNVSITFFLFSPLRAINIQLQTESSLHDREWICSLGKKQAEAPALRPMIDCAADQFLFAGEK